MLPDFSDTLVEYAYDRQIHCDPELAAYYLECLQVITEQRGTEQLQLTLALLQSSHETVSRRDLSAAYRRFGVSLAESKTITDDQLLDRFQAQHTDLGPIAQQEARDYLHKIGVSRNSSLLINASQQSVETYEAALNWLGNGATKDTSDEGLIAVFGVKVCSLFNIALNHVLTSYTEERR